MKIVTFNIRCCWDGQDGVNSFIHRAGIVLEQIRKEKPDVIGFQEVTDQIGAFLERNLPEYLFLGHGRSGDYTGEGPVTAIRQETVKLIGLDVFWLTDTPYESSRLPHQSLCPRTCVATVLLDRKEKKLITVYNAHLDHPSGEKAAGVRLREMQILAEHANARQRLRETPFVLLGDFNAQPEEPVVAYCKKEFPIGLSDVSERSGGTFHNFLKPDYKPCKIDYIFTDRKTARHTSSVDVWKTKADGIPLSDHYPLAVEIRL